MAENSSVNQPASPEQQDHPAEEKRFAREFHDLYRLPEYREAGIRLMTEASRRAVRNLSPILKQIRFVDSEQLGRSVLGPKAESEVVSQWPQEWEMTLDFQRVLHGDYSALLDEVFGLAPAQAEAFEGQLLRMTSNVCDITGQVVKHHDRPIDHDMLLDSLERLPWRFDDDGNPIHDDQMVVVNPKTAEQLRKLPPPTPEQEQRHQEMIEKKRQEFYANRRVRRLSRRP